MIAAAAKKGGVGGGDKCLVVGVPLEQQQGEITTGTLFVHKRHSSFKPLSKAVSNGPSTSSATMSPDEVTKAVAEIGSFSPKLQKVLDFILGQIHGVRSDLRKEGETRKCELEDKCKSIGDAVGRDSDRFKEILKRENEERQRELRDLEAFARKENAERKAEAARLDAIVAEENGKRAEENKAVKERMEKEKQQMREYLENDAKEIKRQVMYDARFQPTVFVCHARQIGFLDREEEKN